MIKTTIEFLEFLLSLSPFFVSLIIWTILAITLSKSIKKNAKTYYWVFGILGFAFAIPPICRVCGLDVPFSINSVPVIGKIASELSDAAYFIHPVIVIIMAMGAFNPKIKWVGRLMSIRKELSILVGFPLLAHLAKRLFNTFPSAWKYFANYEESIASPKVVSQLGSDISNAVYVLGVVMTVLFIVLWVTSFSSVRRKMGQKRWKSVQRWSYALYAMLFIHAVGIQLGGAISYNARQKANQEKVVVEQPAAKASEGHSHGAQQPAAQASEGHSHDTQQPAAGASSAHGHSKPKSFSFADVEVNRACKAKVNILIYILVYGSYLVLRLRKAKQDKLRKRA